MSLNSPGSSDKVDIIQVSTGAHHGSFDKTSMFMERGVNVRFAEEIKKHVKIPVSTIGALNSRRCWKTSLPAAPTP